MVRKLISSILLLIPLFGFSQGNFMFNQHGNLSAEIDTATYINFIVETSSLLPDSINAAIQNNIKDSLVVFYGSEAVYTSHVTLIAKGTERILGADYLDKDITTILSTNTKKVVNIIFEDEVNYNYYIVPFNTTAFDTTYEDDYKEDINSIRTHTEDWRNTLRYAGIVFWVDLGGSRDLDLFLDAVYNGQGVYVNSYALSDRQNQFKFYYSSTNKMTSDSETREYYTGKVLSALRDLGFDL